MQNVHPADGLGELKAVIADLEKKADVFRAMLIEMGEGAHEGAVFRATVSTAERAKLDKDAVIAKLQPSHQLLTAHTTYQDVTTVRVVARNGKGV